MDVSIALLADAANVSQEGKLNILGTFDIVYLPTLPGAFGPANLVLRFNIAPAERGRTRSLAVVLVDPDGRELSRLDGTLELAPDTPPDVEYVNLILPIHGFLRFERYGPHHLSIQVNDDQKKRISIQVKPPVVTAGGEHG